MVWLFICPFGSGRDPLLGTGLRWSQLVSAGLCWSLLVCSRQTYGAPRLTGDNQTTGFKLLCPCWSDIFFHHYYYCYYFAVCCCLTGWQILTTSLRGCNPPPTSQQHFTVSPLTEMTDSCSNKMCFQCCNDTVCFQSCPCDNISSIGLCSIHTVSSLVWNKSSLRICSFVSWATTWKTYFYISTAQNPLIESDHTSSDKILILE